jgi:hypothetical protein
MVKKAIKKSIVQKVCFWFKQRRVWAAGLSALAAVLGSLGYSQYVELVALIAGGLALHSFVKPKK